jgi:creatinine amidohydrolase
VVVEAARQDLADVGEEDNASRPYVTAGIGGSEGAARVLATVLDEAGVEARYEPSSTFALERVGGGTLVVFSQHLSPNGRLALGARDGFRRTVLFTSRSTASGPAAGALRRAGVRVVGHPPDEETGLLLRVVGPAAQLALALRFAERAAARQGRPRAWTGAWGALPDALAAAAERGRSMPLPERAFEGRLAVVGVGRMGDLASSLRQKLVEGLGRCELWDALGLAHGPLQGIYAEEATLFVPIDDACAKQAELLRRLRAVLDPSRHHVVALPSRLPGPLALLEHDATMNALLGRALERHPRDLGSWPGKGKDVALYELDERLEG